MAYELHVWGPAFGLPSIDAECLAAIAYLKCSLPPEQWVLVIQHDPSVSPTGQLPALRNISQWAAGFDAIVRYLSKKAIRPDPPGIEDHLTADYGIPLYLRVHSEPLLAAHLYTTQKNWVNATRPAYTAILPTFANYLIPPNAHSKAESVSIANAMPVGIEGDADLPPSSDPSKQAQLQAQGKLDTSSPSLLFAQSKQTVHEALQARQMTTRFRLEVLVDELLDVLNSVLPSHDNAFLYRADSPTTLDCAIYGYLAPLLTSMPVDWIPLLVAERHPKVKAYVERLGRSIFPEGPVDAKAAMTCPIRGSAEDEHSTTYHGLPYRRAPASTPLRTTRIISTALLDHLVSPTTRLSLFSSPHGLVPRVCNDHLPWAIGIGLPVATAIGYLAFYFATLRKGSPEKVFGRGQSRLASLGPAGAALGMIWTGQARSFPDGPTLGMDGADVVDLGGTGSIAR